MIFQRKRKAIRQTWRIVFLLLFASPVLLFSQQHYFDVYSVSEGLAQSTVFNIIQDKNDIYWLGTQAGVSRFDGVEFVNYTAEDGLAEGGVRAILEDSQGNIWFGHDGGGITRFDGKVFQVFQEASLHFKSNITNIVEDAEGKLWIASQANGAAYVMNPEAPLTDIKYEMYMGKRLSDRIFGSMVGNDSSLYFVTDPVVKKFSRDSMKFDNLELNGIPKFFATTSILEDSKDNFWFGTYHGGLFRYEPDKDDTRMYDLIKMGMNSNWVSALFEDSRGDIWIGTWGGGVGRLDKEDRLTVFDSRNGNPGNKIWKIMEDQEGNLILATNEHGISVFKGDYFVSYFEEDGLVNSQVFAVEEALDKSFWIGTNAGISIIVEQGDLSRISSYEPLKNKRIRFISSDRAGNMWIGVEGHGVYTVYRNGDFRFDPSINRIIPNNLVTGLTVDKDNNLWIGTLDGLIYYEIDSKKYDMLTQVNGLSGNEISTLFSDSKGRLWIGMEGKGITVIDGTEFHSPDLGMNFTPRCFTEDRNGIIWVGTEGRGVLAYDTEEKQVVKQLTVEDGLLANLINILNCDEANQVYIGTNKGLNKYLQDEDKLYAFTEKSGFVGIETKPNATCKDSKGRIWFGTGLGITRYDPRLKPKSVMEPLTHITALKVNYEPYPFEDGMELSYRQNALIFNYRSITLNPEAVKYKIKLEGVDKDWRPESDQTEANYPALRPKKYTFYVTARNSDGVWNDPPLSLSFQIKPPFYLTAWFIALLVFLVAVAIFTYIRLRERALLRENRILEEKVRIRTAEVVSQKEELAQKNKDITDSIRYAKRIQFAILPPKSPFPETFILFKPKDIVSGDFYWFTEVDGREFIAAVDCTGHGVPGAFMSIIGHNSLNKIVNHSRILEPGRILSELNREVVETLHHTVEDGDVVDGMDLSLVSFHKKEMKIEYAGAYNSVYLVSDGELQEIKADRQPIGLSGGAMKEFSTRSMDIKKGDMLYMFSDGYADQFGGEKLKKFKSRNMKELLLRIHSQPVSKQRKILDDAIEKWKGAVEQVDDILIIGRRF